MADAIASRAPARATTVALATRLTQLRRDILHHKRAIRLHREQLAVTAAELRTLETECAARGQALIIRKA